MYADFLMKTYKGAQAQKRRERIFTNKKSAYIHGRFKVTEPRDGMFIFKPLQIKGNNLVNERFVEGRIGVLIDIFDNSAHGQDVVELIMVNTRKPTDFLMYYEHPDNGDGR